MSIPAVSANGLAKQFGATRALDGVDFDVLPGEVHALVGENGAGKSTLVRILGGVHPPDHGAIAVNGRACHFNGPRDAIATGIVAIPQELRLVPALSVAENLTLGDPPLRRLLGVKVVDGARMRREARAELAQLDFAPDPDGRVDRLSFAERQLVAIARALHKQCQVLILDEPTAALETREIERLFAVLAQMKSQGTAIVYVSHRLDEVVALADRCTVLRDGRVAATSRRGDFKVGDLVAAMTGRAAAKIETQALSPGEVLLEDVTARPDAIRLRAREVIGLAGLLGSGEMNAVRPYGHVFEQHIAWRQRLRFDFRRGAAGHGCNQIADIEVAAAAGCRDAAIAQHRAAVGERDHLVQPVRDVHDRRALTLHPRQHGKQSLDLARFERRRRLIENEDLTLFTQRFGDRDQLTFGKAQTIDAAVGIWSEVELRQFRARLTPHAHTVNELDTQQAPQRRVAERQVLGN